MFETATNAQHLAAIKRAHEERAQAFATMLTYVARPFRALTWPQVSTRRLPAQPQGCPAGT